MTLRGFLVACFLGGLFGHAIVLGVSAMHHSAPSMPAEPPPLGVDYTPANTDIMFSRCPYSRCIQDETGKTLSEETPYDFMVKWRPWGIETTISPSPEKRWLDEEPATLHNSKDPEVIFGDGGTDEPEPAQMRWEDYPLCDEDGGCGDRPGHCVCRGPKGINFDLPAGVGP